MNAKSTQQLEHRWRWQFALGNRIHRHFCSALVAIFEALHKQALNSSLPICNLSSARFMAIFLCRIHQMMPGRGAYAHRVVCCVNLSYILGCVRREKRTMIDILFSGIGWTDIALTLNRIAVGMFFMLSDPGSDE